MSTLQFRVYFLQRFPFQGVGSHLRYFVLLLFSPRMSLFHKLHLIFYFFFIIYFFIFLFFRAYRLMTCSLRLGSPNNEFYKGPCLREEQTLRRCLAAFCMNRKRSKRGGKRAPELFVPNRKPRFLDNTLNIWRRNFCRKTS